MAAILLVEALLLHKGEDAREADAIGDELQPAACGPRQFCACSASIVLLWATSWETLKRFGMEQWSGGKKEGLRRCALRRRTREECDGRRNLCCV